MELENYINRNVRAAPPFSRYDTAKGSSEWGDAIKSGPAEVDRQVRIVADAFIEVTRAELTSWLR